MAVFVEKCLSYIESQLKQVRKGREAGTNSRCSQRGVFQELSIRREVTILYMQLFVCLYSALYAVNKYSHLDFSI